MSQLLGAEFEVVARREVKMYCPFCADPHPAHLHLQVDLDKGIFYCYRCRRGGVISRTAQMLFGLSEMKGSDVEEGPPRSRKKKEANEVREFEARVIPGYRSLVDDVRMGSVQHEAVTSYLESRGLDLGTLYEFSVGVSSEYPFYAIFPFYEWYGGEQRLVFFTGRLVIDSEKQTKYVFPSRSDGWPGKSELVYGLERVKQGGVVTITEGVLDAITCPFGVAIMGSGMSVVQATKIIALHPSKIVLMLDGDAAGAAGRAQVSAMLRQCGYNGPIVHACMPDGTDPCGLGRVACIGLIKGAVRWRSAKVVAG